MPVTQFRGPKVLTPAQERIEAIIKVASEQGMGGFALARVRTAATDQIEPLVDALVALKELSAMYASTWDRVDGALVMMDTGIDRFEKAHKLAQDAIAKATLSGTR